MKKNADEEDVASIRNEGQLNIIKEGGEAETNKVTHEPDQNGKVAAPKWDQLDDMGLPIIDKAKDPETAKEVEIVRTLIK